MPPPMSFDRLDTTPDKMDAMSGHANRLSSGTRSNNETCSVADPFPDLRAARATDALVLGARSCAVLTAGVDFDEDSFPSLSISPP